VTTAICQFYLNRLAALQELQKLKVRIAMTRDDAIALLTG